jgi:hypothetical protein
MKPMKTVSVGLLTIAVVLTVGALACEQRIEAFDKSNGLPTCAGAVEQLHDFPQSVERDVDLLFVVDTSPKMAAMTGRLVASLPEMVEALRLPKLTHDGLLNVRIGVVSADLGAGSNVGIPGCRLGGDGGKLLNKPRRSGCVAPVDPWIAYDYHTGGTNVPSGAADGVDRVKEALACVGDLGSSGCLFSQPLEAAKRALDPKLNLNPGFLRDKAFLMLVFLTAGDDCSAARSELFDPAPATGSDPLGPLTPFRCFEHGVSCSCSGSLPCKDPRSPGGRKSCVPQGDWLHPVERYATFFSTLKPPGRLIVSSISGPAKRIGVELTGGLPTLEPSCTSSGGAAGSGWPAVRLQALTRALETRGAASRFNEGADPSLTLVPVDICSDNLGQATRVLGRTLYPTDTGHCVRGVPLSNSCGVILAGVDGGGGPGLFQAACSVKMSWPLDKTRPAIAVSRCPLDLFQDKSAVTCSYDKSLKGVGDAGAPFVSGTCPCWRLVHSSSCNPVRDGSPLQLQVLSRPSQRAMARVVCATGPN